MGSDYFSLQIYFILVVFVTLTVLALSGIFPSIHSSDTKFMPYESGIRTATNLLNERFPLRHYLVALLFLVFDIEIIFMYPWAAVAKEIGRFAFYEMTFFIATLAVGFTYVWRKRGLEWE
ncbi:MAG: NADH-quinone oxidoreductase subunit A [Parachlamydia sp.]|jgi:NADH:ubiquinone oxidoreductase subunit 3 (subunit A)|nr:NADH-quinone oxidoreductase subunit A [Parachlamydia sp.]